MEEFGAAGELWETLLVACVVFDVAGALCPIAWEANMKARPNTIAGFDCLLRLIDMVERVKV
jgi:hypothetical protein